MLLLCWTILHHFRHARANSVFWSRALNIPFPRSYIFPQVQEDQGSHSPINNSQISCNSGKELVDEQDEKGEISFPLWVSGWILAIEGFMAVY